MTDPGEYKEIINAVNDMRSEIEYLKRDSRAPQYSYLSDAHMTKVLRPLALKHGLVMSPAFTPGGAPIAFTSLGKNSNMHMLAWQQSFLLTHTSGQVWPELITVMAQGMDAGDKAANKGLTAAHRYAWVRLLFLETGDDPEADRSTDNPGATPEKQQSKRHDIDQPQGSPSDAPTELHQWIEEVGRDHVLNKDEMQRWGIWKTCFRTAQELYGKMKEGDSRMFNPMTYFGNLHDLGKGKHDNKFTAALIQPFREYCANEFQQRAGADDIPF